MKVEKKKKTTKKCGCPFGFSIRSQDYGQTYYIDAVRGGERHNHNFLVHIDGHRHLTAMRPEHLEFLGEQADARVQDKSIRQGIISKFGDKLTGLPGIRQIQYQKDKRKKEKRGTSNPAQQMFHLANVENYASWYVTDKEQRLTHFFMIHPGSLQMLKT